MTAHGVAAADKKKSQMLEIPADIQEVCFQLLDVNSATSLLESVTQHKRELQARLNQLLNSR